MSVLFQIKQPTSEGCYISFRTETEAVCYWHETIEKLPTTDIRHGAIVSRYTFESDYEAETARLDFMISTGSIAKFSEACLKLDRDSFRLASDWPQVARKAIDIAREAPKSESVQIWPKEVA